MHIVASIFFVQDFAISGHQHRNRIRQQQHPGGNSARHPVGSRVPDPGIF
jgi:hypothetical protein